MVSVIITTFGANRRLIRAIDSVLNQTFKDIEVIIVDDNNPESVARTATERMMEEYKGNSSVKYIKNPVNMNGAAARNSGLKEARGEYIAFLDDDDFYLPQRLEKAVDFLKTHPNVSGVCQDVIRINNNFLVDITQVEDEQILTVEELLVSKNGIGSGSNILLSKSVIMQVGGFDVSFLRKQDIEFMLRVVKIGKVIYLHDVQIVKDISGVRKISYENNKKALQLFTRKFNREINSLTKDQIKQYYVTQYSFLLNIAKTNGNKTQIEETTKDLLQYTNVSKNFGERAFFAISVYLNRSKSPIIHKISARLKKIKYLKRNKRIKSLLGHERYQELAEILEHYK